LIQELIQPNVRVDEPNSAIEVVSFDLKFVFLRSFCFVDLHSDVKGLIPLDLSDLRNFVFVEQDEVSGEVPEVRWILQGVINAKLSVKGEEPLDLRSNVSSVVELVKVDDLT
jgi:hypothetical protein